MVLVLMGFAGIPMGQAMSFGPVELRQGLPHETVEKPDGVPEHWVLGEEVIEGEELELEERWRVLAGSRLVIDESTLRFASHPDGPTGIVAEPGSEVWILGSTLEALMEGSFVVYLEGESQVTNTQITGAERVVLQPRSLTDQAEALLGDLLGEAAEGLVPGWSLARALSNATARMSSSGVDSAVGPGLVLGAPVQDLDSPLAQPAIRVKNTDVGTESGAAVTCYTTRSAPDPEGSLPGPALVQPVLGWARLEGLSASSGDDAGLECPLEPDHVAPPPRPLPGGVLGGLPVVPGLVPSAPRAEPVAGMERLEMRGGTIGPAGTGVHLAAPVGLDMKNTHFVDSALGVLLDSPDAAAELVDVTTVSLEQAVRVVEGSLNAAGSVFGQPPEPGLTGVWVIGGSATLDDTSIRDYGLCLRATVALTITASSFNGCGVGVLLDAVTGATVTDNSFTLNADPLRVHSPDPEANPDHYDHTVTGNTVHDKDLLYVFDETGSVFAQDAGHAVVAHSVDVRIEALDLTQGRLHHVAVIDLVVAAPTDLQSLLLMHVVPAAAPGFDGVFEGVTFEPYPGALKGPKGTLHQGSGNALDQAWALVDVLEREGLDAHVVRGTLQLPFSAYRNWIGVPDVNTALGVWNEPGTIIGDTLRLDHSWVGVQGAPGVTVEVDPSYRQYDWLDPMDLDDFVGWLDEDFYDEFIEASTIEPDQHRVRDLPTGLIHDEVARGHDELTQWLKSQGEMTTRDLLGGAVARPVAPEEASLREAESVWGEVPSSAMWSVEVTSYDPFTGAPRGLQHADSTPELYGKRLALASSAHESTFAWLLDQGGLYEVDRRDVDLTTRLWVDGEPVSQDPSPLHPGDLLGIRIYATSPGGQTVTHTSPVRVGGSYAVVLDIGRTSEALVREALAEYEAILESVTDGDGQVGQEALYGQMHHLHGLVYFQQVHETGKATASMAEILDQPLVSMAVTGQSLAPVGVFDGSTWQEVLDPTPPYIDVMSWTNAYPRDGDQDRLPEYFLGQGMFSSALEDHIFTQIHNLPSVSTVKALNVANQQGQPLYTINASNANEVLPLLELPNPVLQSIVNAVNSGRHVLVHHEEIEYLDWTGAGWVEYNPETGAAGWLIRGAASPTLGTHLAEPQIIRGGAGATHYPFSMDGLERPEWLSLGDGGFWADWDGLDWTKEGLGSVLDLPFETWGEMNDAWKDQIGRAGTWADYGSKAINYIDWGLEAYGVLSDSDRSWGDRAFEAGSRTAYNVAASKATGAAVLKAGAVGAVVCAKAFGVGAIVCGGGAAIGTSIGLSYTSGSIKRWIFGD